MDKTILELQGMTMSEEHLARMKGIVLPANDKARSVADEKLRFDDEPAHYTGFLDAGA
jgi:hypothetical protein